MPDRALSSRSSGKIAVSDVLNSLREKLAEMELHDDLPDSFDMGYMAAWSEINTWLKEESWR